MTSRIALSTLLAVCAASCPCWSQLLPDDPPLILNLGSNDSDGSVSIACAGTKPFLKLSCKVYRLSVERPTVDEFQKSRNALEKDLEKTSEADVIKNLRQTCSTLDSVESEMKKNLSGYSPGRAASAQDGINQMKAVCRCQTKQCVTGVTLEQQTHEQNECTVGSSVFSAEFVKVSSHKWVSNNGPEGICGVVSLFTLEEEANYPELWTYTEKYTHTNNDADNLCKLAHDTTSIYSWKSGRSVRLKCEELKFDVSPESN